MNEIIKVQGLTVVYPGGKKAVDDLEFSVNEGEIFGFLGPNGAGKSTTISVLTTLLRANDDGKVFVNGKDVKTNPDGVRESIGYVSQSVAVDESISGYDNLRILAGFNHIPGEVKERIDKVLGVLGLSGIANKLVKEYSGGERRKLDIAGALIHNPNILILDEPTVGVDIEARAELWKYIRKLRDEGMTILLTTHHLDEAEALCDRICIIHNGKLKVLGTPEALKRELDGNIMEFSFASGTPEEIGRVVKIIKDLDFVKEVKSRGDNLYEAVITIGETAVPEILYAAADFPVRIDAVSFKGPTLEDVFLKYAPKEESVGEEKKATRFTKLVNAVNIVWKRLRGVCPKFNINPMLSDIYWVFWREMRKLSLSNAGKLRIVFMPIFWFFLVGYKMSPLAGNPNSGGSYNDLLLPAIMVMTSLNTGSFGGTSIIVDRNKGFLYKMLAAPIKRASIPLGKILGALVQNWVELVVLAGIAVLSGVNLAGGISAFLFMFLVCSLLCMIMGGLCLAIAATTESSENLSYVVSLANMFLVFSSNAIFPAKSEHQWLNTISEKNPVTLIVDILRNGWEWESALLIVGILVVSAVVFILLAVRQFKKSIV